MWDWLHNLEKSSRKLKTKNNTWVRHLFRRHVQRLINLDLLFVHDKDTKETDLFVAFLLSPHFKRTDEAKIPGNIALESLCGLSHPRDGWKWEITASLHGTSRSFTPPYIPKRRRAALWLTINSVILSHTLWSPLQHGFRSWQWCNRKSIASFGYF